MLEKLQDRRSQSREGDTLPYNPQDWNRRLAEARARRAATLKKGGSRRGPAVTPSQCLADAWDGDREGLAVVTGPIGGAWAGLPEAARAPEAGADDVPARPWPWAGPAVTLLAGCLIGSTVTGFLFLASEPESPEAVLPSAGALMATVSDAIAEQPADAATGGGAPAEAAGDGPAARTARADDERSDGASPTPADPAEIAAPVPAPQGDRPEPPVRTASADSALPADSVRPPAPPPALAPAEALPVGWMPAAGPARQFDAPSMVNAPQVQYHALPAAPPSIESVVVLAPNSVSAAGRNETASLLREAGWPARDPGASPFTIASTHVRYYHPGDREGAERLAALFSAEARNFTSYSPRPPSGMIELWLAGRSPPREPERQGPSLTRFLGRIAAALEGRG